MRCFLEFSLNLDFHANGRRGTMAYILEKHRSSMRLQRRLGSVRPSRWALRAKPQQRDQVNQDLPTVRSSNGAHKRFIKQRLLNVSPTYREAAAPQNQRRSGSRSEINDIDEQQNWQRHPCSRTRRAIDCDSPMRAFLRPGRPMACAYIAAKPLNFQPTYSVTAR